MVFWKCSITVLLVSIVFSLASILAAPKVHAFELVPKNTISGTLDEVCTPTQFLSLGKHSCTKHKKSASTFTLTPLVSPLPTLKETKEPEITPTITPESAPTTIPTPIDDSSLPTVTPEPTGTLSASVLFELVNNYRKQINLAPLQQDERVCSVAASRMNEMPQEIRGVHALHQGFYAKNLPYWATENMIYQHTEEAALRWWLNSPVHRSAIQGDYKYACGVCNGEVCDMIFTNYQEKVFSSSTTTKTIALQ